MLRLVAALALGVSTCAAAWPFTHELRADVTDRVRAATAQDGASEGVTGEWTGEGEIQNSAANPNCRWQAAISLEARGGRAELVLEYPAAEPLVEPTLPCPAARAADSYETAGRNGTIRFDDRARNTWTFERLDGRLEGSVEPSAEGAASGNAIYARSLLLDPVEGSAASDDDVGDIANVAFFAGGSVLLAIPWLALLTFVRTLLGRRAEASIVPGRPVPAPPGRPPAPPGSRVDARRAKDARAEIEERKRTRGKHLVVWVADAFGRPDEDSGIGLVPTLFLHVVVRTRVVAIDDGAEVGLPAVRYAWTPPLLPARTSSDHEVIHQHDLEWTFDAGELVLEVRVSATGYQGSTDSVVVAVPPKPGAPRVRGGKPGSGAYDDLE